MLLALAELCRLGRHQTRKRLDGTRPFHPAHSQPGHRNLVSRGARADPTARLLEPCAVSEDSSCWQLDPSTPSPDGHGHVGDEELRVLVVADGCAATHPPQLRGRVWQWSKHLLPGRIRFERKGSRSRRSSKVASMRAGSNAASETASSTTATSIMYLLTATAGIDSRKLTGWSACPASAYLSTVRWEPKTPSAPVNGTARERAHGWSAARLRARSREAPRRSVHGHRSRLLCAGRWDDYRVVSQRCGLVRPRVSSSGGG
jgi:hypothetical protein